MKMNDSSITSFLFRKLTNIVLIAGTAYSVAVAQGPKLEDTIYIPVTFYDFHSDSSNPEFEIAPSGTPVKTGMVGNKLDSDRKPVLGNSPYFNRRIDRWFRKWVAGDSTIYNYYNEYPARFGRYQTYPSDQLIQINHDTSFINKVIPDSLPFVLIDSATGTYEFADDNFFPIDGKGFGNEGRSHNYSFAMELHWEFTKIPGLNFEFRGDDDVWAFVGDTINGSILRMDLGGIHQFVDGSFDLDQESDLVNFKKYNLDFFYVERHVVGSSIRITTNLVSPTVTLDFKVVPNDTICPFEPVMIHGIVKDDINGLRPDLSKNTQWSIIDYNGQPSGILKQTVGDSVLLIPEVAYSRIIIGAAVFNGTDTMKGQDTIYVGPCAAYKIYIEEGPVDTTDTNSLRFPQELTQISIMESKNTGEGYAIARDISGAYVRLADSLTTLWAIDPLDDTTLAKVTGETNKKYHGVVTRIGVDGTTYATAEEPGLLKDSVVVVIAPYYIVRLQLRDSAGTVIDTIRMMTDDTREYFVWGLKSNAPDTNNPVSTDWVATNAKWILNSDSITVKNALKDNAHSWIMDPTHHGEGMLNLTKPEDPRTPELNVPVFVYPSPASRVEITLLTPAPRRAGDTLLLEVRIFNTDGLVPGTFTFGADGNNPNEAIYSDRLGVGGGKRPYPTIQVNGIDTLLNVLDQNVFTIRQQFINGVDTVKTVLFYAPHNPSSDSMHQITVSYGIHSTLTDKTEKFALQPNDLDSIAIEDVNYNIIPPQVLKGDESVTPYSDGYDKYGNRIGFIATKWNTTGTLYEINDSAKYTYITAKDITEDQSGDLCAKKYNEKNELIQACLPITIIGPKKTVSSALTRDLDGDGQLDAIEFTIDRAVLPEEISFSNFANIKHGTTTFIPNAISFIDTNMFIVHFEEQDSLNPQTVWQLYYDIQDASTIANTERALTEDGAGPVIWEIIRNVKDQNVKIILSEKVLNVTNNRLNTDDNPSLTFNVYLKESKGFVEVPLLTSITKFSSILSDSIVMFLLPDSVDLSIFHYMNLETNPSTVKDNYQNLPHPDNIKRKVRVVGQKENMVIGPNPTRPSVTHTPAGVLTLENDREAIEIAKNGMGTIIQLTLTRDTMSAMLKVHDIAGNMVNWAYVPNYLEYLERTGGLKGQEHSSILLLTCYWNGYNAKGMPVSPGVYRIVFTVDYKNPVYKDAKFVEIQGIKK